MDTTKKYIEMCEKAEEIQESWDAEVGDFSVTGDNIIIVYFDHEYDELEYGLHWLPRQDELQGMVDYDNNPYVLASEFMDFINVENEIMCVPREPIMDSWEQLWLAFVMKEKYQKRWNDKKKDWVKG